VYGKLISTWPVAGGVVADQGVVYAAAGIAHYDGAYVYALDAVTGKVKWCNDTSGSISDVTGSGVSLQGNLYVRNGELRFLAGSAYETASYDLKTGKCLNEAYDKPGSRFETAFYPYFPQYGKHLSLDCDLPDGRWLVYDASYEGSRHSSLALKPAFPPGAVKPVVEESRWRSVGGRQAQQLKAVWQDKSGRRFSAFVVGPNLLLAAGQAGPNEGGAPILAAVNIQDGSDTWLEKLPAMAVPGGAAIDHARRIFVSLEDGRVLCFTPEENPAAKAAQ
jgi:outer membrane protein assembly factor BamB